MSKETKDQYIKRLEGRLLDSSTQHSTQMAALAAQLRVQEEELRKMSRELEEAKAKLLLPYTVRVKLVEAMQSLQQLGF